MKVFITFGSFDELSLDLDSIESIEGLADVRGDHVAIGKDGQPRWRDTVITMKTGTAHTVPHSKPEVHRRIASVNHLPQG